METLDFDNPSALQKSPSWTARQLFHGVLSRSTTTPCPMPLATQAVYASYGTNALLPIEFFKYHADDLCRYLSAPTARSFLSSGTTRADRSQSHFTASGLQLYRKFALETFQAVLAYFFPKPLAVKGWSLIPPVHDWPDSSLAQMVGWLAEEQELSYWNGLGPAPEEPVWVFGTAFHFVNLADDGVRLQLPKGSVVIETGGTKGRSRSVTREELYQLIEASLGIPRNRIISEYGMCELASQAYDFVENPDGPELKLEERWFRFPFFTSVSIMDRLSRPKATGTGTLVIQDKLRTDYPWPIRTEDMACVREDGAFQLLGRVPLSPLKGCSMLAEQISNGSPVMDCLDLQTHQSNVSIKESSKAIHEIAQNLLHDEDFWKLWLAELGNATAVAWLREDLERSLPKDPASWERAAVTAQGDRCPPRWLIIPPDSHSYAWVYPLFLGSVMGLELHIRGSVQDPLLGLVRERLSRSGKIHLWDSQKRIGADALPPVDALMIYGSDETIASIQAMTSLPIQGFGSYLTASLLLEKDWENCQNTLWRDALSLLQKGCMASRIAFLLRDEETSTAPHFSSATAPMGELPLGLELALEHGAFAWRCQGQTISRRVVEGSPLVVVQVFDFNKTLADYLLDRAISLSLVLIPKKLWPDFAVWLVEQKNLCKIVASARTFPLARKAENLEWVEPGFANAPMWNGLHQNRPLFGL